MLRMPRQALAGASACLARLARISYAAHAQNKDLLLPRLDKCLRKPVRSSFVKGVKNGRTTLYSSLLKHLVRWPRGRVMGIFLSFTFALQTPKKRHPTRSATVHQKRPPRGSVLRHASPVSEEPWPYFAQPGLPKIKIWELILPDMKKALEPKPNSTSQ